MISFLGYPRGDSFGVRNHVVIMASVSCVNPLVEKLGREYSSIKILTHPNGCGHLKADRDQVLRTLVGSCNHPNIAGVLIVGLGCESIVKEQLQEKINSGEKYNRKVETIGVQESGEIESFYSIAREKLDALLEYAATQKPVQAPISALRVGVECGGSDIFSGITANPTIGKFSDKLVEHKGSVIISEIPEMIGTESIISERIVSEESRTKFFEKINFYIDLAKKAGTDLRGVNPTPGNIRAGLSTLEEKSLGAIAKAGTSSIVEVLDYSEPASRPGLAIMDSPGNDPESVTGMVASGAQIILFSTGMGTPYGHPIAPVVKISSNTELYNRMSSYIDFDTGDLVGDNSMLGQKGDDLFDLVLKIASGEKVKAEINECDEFAISRVTPLI